MPCRSSSRAANGNSIERPLASSSADTTAAKIKATAAANEKGKRKHSGKKPGVVSSARDLAQPEKTASCKRPQDGDARGSGMAVAAALAVAKPRAADGDEPSNKKTRRKATAGGKDDSPAAPRGNKDFDVLAHEGCPKNVEIPKDLTFSDAPRPDGVIRISSWNIVSLKSAEPKGLVRYLEAEDADIVFLSETKVNEVPSFFQSSRYPHQTWGIGATKSYAGVALLSKIKPLAVHKGLPNAMPGDYDTKSRCIMAEFAHCYVVGTYCVNAGEGLKSMETKKAWNEALSRCLCQLDAIKPIIWTGDLNVVYDSDDLSRASAKWNKSAGYTQIECDHHRALLEGCLDYVQGQGQRQRQQPFVDVWREKHPGFKGHFTYYAWRGQCRIKGSGWRIDTFIVSQRAKNKCHRCEIRQEVYGASDHVPIIADFDASLFGDVDEGK